MGACCGPDGSDRYGPRGWAGGGEGETAGVCLSPLSISSSKQARTLVAASFTLDVASLSGCQ